MKDSLAVLSSQLYNCLYFIQKIFNKTYDIFCGFTEKLKSVHAAIEQVKNESHEKQKGE